MLRLELVQGLADTFILLGMPFDSEEAKQLNKEIFETIYFAALETSCALAKIDGALSEAKIWCVIMPIYGRADLAWVLAWHASAVVVQAPMRLLQAAQSARVSCSTICGG